jgi:cyclopropane fatty-acyl-phospholipid synthase-like methyltransferase
MSSRRIFDWDEVYKNNRITELPWYYADLDDDLDNALDKLGLKSGTFLDLGTGPATQAKRLDERGFDVTGVDISGEAIKLAKKTYPHIEFQQDDILKTNLSKKFDFIFDRGCFHVIDVNKRKIYAENVFNLLNDSGLLFLKCFSNKMPDSGSGPHRISKRIIKTTFESLFIVEDIHETEFKNESNPYAPKALFVIMKKRHFM